ILSENRWEWLVADHGILSAGAVDVPIHAPSTAAQIQYQLEHSGAIGVLLSTPEQWEKVSSVKAQLPDLRFVIGMDETPATTRLEGFSWDGVVQAGALAGEGGRLAV